MATALVLGAVLLIAAAAVTALRRDKKQGKSACGGNCATCAGCAGCHQADAQAKRA